MQFRIFLAVTLVLCLLSGCNRQKRPDGMPPLFPCDITITQDGKPLDEADVRLVLESGTTDWITAGKTNASGVAKLSTHAQFAGAPAGTFKVLVSKNVPAPSKYPMPAQDASPDEWSEWRGKVQLETCPLVRYVKPEYENANTTPHSITITKGKNTATFNVGEAIQEDIR